MKNENIIIVNKKLNSILVSKLNRMKIQHKLKETMPMAFIYEIELTEVDQLLGLMSYFQIQVQYVFKPDYEIRHIAINDFYD